MIPDVPVPILAWKGMRRQKDDYGKIQWWSPTTIGDSRCFEVGVPQKAHCVVFTVVWVDVHPTDVIDNTPISVWKQTHGHPPGAGCTCGFYVTKHRRHAAFYGTHVARVRIWGKVVEHQYGYRAEFIELIGTPKRVIAPYYRLLCFSGVPIALTVAAIWFPVLRYIPSLLYLGIVCYVLWDLLLRHLAAPRFVTSGLERLKRSVRGIRAAYTARKHRRNSP